MTTKFTVGSELLKTETRCNICHSKNNLEPHHIIPVNNYDEFYNSKDNVIILCHKCHHRYHQENMGDINFKSLLEFKGKIEQEKCKKLKKKYNALHKSMKYIKKNARLKGLEL